MVRLQPDRRRVRRARELQKILFGDPRFQEAVGRTIYFTIVAVGAETVLGVAMALLFNREFWGRGLLRTLAILPMVATRSRSRSSS